MPIIRLHVIRGDFMTKKGFTLIELLAVVAVLGIITLIAVPSTINVLDKNKKEAFINDAKKIMRRVEVEDQRNDYKNQMFVVNNKKSSGTVQTPNYYNYITMDDITVSPYDNDYKYLVVYACTAPEKYDSIRYYRIYLSDGEYHLRAVKGLPSNLLNNDVLQYNPDNNPMDLSDSSVNRYKMVERVSGNINNYMRCYGFR